jgi:hypothetical protein
VASVATAWEEIGPEARSSTVGSRADPAAGNIRFEIAHLRAYRFEVGRSARLQPGRFEDDSEMIWVAVNR